MGFLHRLFGLSQGNALAPGRGWIVPVVGESHYQGDLERLYREHGGTEHDVNRHESNYTHLSEFGDNENKLLNASLAATYANEEKTPPILGKPEQRRNLPENAYLKRLVAG